LIAPTRKKLVLTLPLLFLFRLAFGLTSEFWFEDEKQVYLIGLKSFATHTWPYFGPDVTSQIQIPGALVFHIALGVEHYKHVSLYVDRSIPALAIEKSDYRILGERRSGAKY
jgi:hypothetical protein